MSQVILRRWTEEADKILEIISQFQIETYDDSKYLTIDVFPYMRQLEPGLDTPGPKEYGWSVVRRADMFEHDRGVTFCKNPHTNLITVYFNTDPQYIAFKPFYEQDRVEKKEWLIGEERQAAGAIIGYLYREVVKNNDATRTTTDC